MTSPLIFLVIVLVIGTVVVYMLYKQGLREKIAGEQIAEATSARLPTDISAVIETPNVASPLNEKARLSFSKETYMCIKDRLLPRIEAQFPDMRLISSDENYGYPYQADGLETAYRCLTADGLECFISWKTETVDAIKWQNDNFDLEPDASGKIEIIAGLSILYRIQSDQKIARKAKELYATIKADIEATTLKFVKPINAANVGLICHIEHKPGGEPRLEKMYGKVMPPIPGDILNNSYNFGEYQLRASKFKPTPEQRVKGWRIILEDGGNLAFLGPTGTGKTKLVDHILSEMGEDTNVLFLDIDTLQQVRKFPSFLKEAKGDGLLVVVLDEAQHLVKPEQLDPLLQLMEGNKSQDGVVFILSMNIDKANLPKELVRDGRVSEVVELGQISVAQGAALAGAIIRFHPDRVKLGPELDTLLKTEGFTIANVWAKCPKKSVTDKLLGIFSPKKPA